MRSTPNLTTKIVALSALSALLTLSACTKKPEERLHGKWAADVAARPKSALATIAPASMPPEAASAAVEKVTQVASSIALDITPEKMVVTVGGRTHEGNWKITSVEGEAFGVHIEDGKGYKRDVTLTLSGETLTMKDPDVPVPLPRVRAK